MKRNLFVTTVFLIFVNFSFSQKLFYDVKKDRFWIDSLKAAIKKEQNYNTTNQYTKQLKRFNDCIKLGLYYEKCFKKKKIKSNFLALKYYLLITEDGNFPEDDFRYKKLSAIRASVYRKIAAFYYDGVGVKKDKEASLDYALRGFTNNEGYYNYYSLKYFNCNGLFLKPVENKNSDTVFKIVINSFAIKNRTAHLAKRDKIIIEKIANTFKQKLTLDTSIVLNINSSSRHASIRNQIYAHNAIQYIRFFLTKQCGIDTKKIVTEVTVNGVTDFVEIVINKN